MPETPLEPADPASIRKGLRRKRRSRLAYLAVFVLMFAGFVGVVSSPLARIQAVEVKGSNGRADAQLDSATDVVGYSIFWTDSGEVARRIERIAWVERVAVRKNYLRRTLSVEIVPRTAAGFVSTQAGTVLLDGTGMPFEVTSSPPAGILELTGQISGISLGEVSTDAAEVLWCAAVLSRWTKQDFARGGTREGVVFLIMEGGSEVRVGDTSDLEEKGRALRAMQERAVAEGWRVKTYNVVAPRAPALERA